MAFNNNVDDIQIGEKMEPMEGEKNKKSKSMTASISVQKNLFSIS